ncbi:hypothetical protein BDN70DRAFT_993315 [Pholiota conissans]|uniref:Uncharacterized protein n=1 Tax=Pholiota conissans TaxID=109636 RepID=A0A9P6D1H0_9AGAR|nr:hypothetical protein BDN70DRAFT_993315 [Pholiota conissans]
MMILDFSPAAVSSFEKILESKSGSDILVTLLPPTGIFTTEFPIFHTDLFTHLPCVQLTKGLGRGYAEFLMHAEGVLGINPYGDDGISVDVFHLDD